MTYVWGAPLFWMTQLLDCAYSSESEEYDTVEGALQKYVGNSSEDVLRAIVSDFEYLKVHHPDPGTWLDVFAIWLPFSREGFPAFLDIVRQRADDELAARLSA